MCLISDKIKFCTCKGNAEKLKNYWVLYRKRPKGDYDMILGAPRMPASNLNFTINVDTLQNRLNEADAFDTPIEFKARDRFNIYISSGLENGEFFSYTFEFTKGNWKNVRYDPFDLMCRFDDIKAGKLKSAFRVVKTKTNPSKP